MTTTQAIIKRSAALDLGAGLSARTGSRVALALGLALAGCDDDTTGPGGAGGAGGEGGGGGPPVWNAVIEWAPCADDDPAGPGVECAAIEVPANWNDPTGSSITFFVRRILREDSHGQLWALAGGPGQAGWGWAASEGGFNVLAPGLDLYMPDHRGTGDSSFVRCVSTESIGGIENCIEAMEEGWGENIPYFSITQAARDVGEVIAHTRSPEDEVFVLGVSYGTTWGHRYLQLFPEQATGVVLDSPCPNGTCDFSMAQQRATEDMVKSIFDACAEDTVCGEKLGSDPWASFGAVLDQLEAGHCPELGMSRAGFGGTFAFSLLTDTRVQGYLPAAVYRVARCEPADVEAVARLFSVPYAQEGSDWAIGLRTHIIVSEIFPEDSPSIDELRVEISQLYTGGDGPLFSRQAQDLWPMYPRDEYYGAFAETETPLLIMSGTLDPATPPAVGEPWATHYQGEHQHFVPIDRASHMVLNDECGVTLFADFVADPKAPLDTTCATAAPPIDFVGTPEDNELMLGTPDAYENPEG
ncbi:MAG: alpha/beta fold hydrolase [Polyangiaceae bacterium]|nr:alpha/beta fold hydrolase [Polyangiaceae bacterium]